MKRLLEVFRSIRWSDGRYASHEHDRVAWMLRAISLGLLASSVVVYWWANSSLVVWVVLVLAGIAAGVAASVRLRSTVRRIENDGPGAPARHRASSSARFLEFFARRYDHAADKLEARADQAATRGEEAAAAKYRRRAAKERADAARCRDMFA